MTKRLVNAKTLVEGDKFGLHLADGRIGEFMTIDKVGTWGGLVEFYTDHGCFSFHPTSKVGVSA